jgi:hypothetical protein
VSSLDRTHNVQSFWAEFRGDMRETGHAVFRLLESSTSLAIPAFVFNHLQGICPRYQNATSTTKSSFHTDSKALSRMLVLRPCASGRRKRQANPGRIAQAARWLSHGTGGPDQRAFRRWPAIPRASSLASLIGLPDYVLSFGFVQRTTGLFSDRGNLHSTQVFRIFQRLL